MAPEPEGMSHAAAWLTVTGGAQGSQVGPFNEQHNYFDTPPPVVRSAYPERIRQIAPAELRDRANELAELARFCTGPPEPAYLWWRAPAWSGKSALMSWFALHPPGGVRVVSFFVRAQDHRQYDRRAFADNVLEQLAELLDHRRMPAGLTDSTRDTHVTALLAEAAAKCHRAGERLILLVDGLDEDRGVQAGPDSYSIAALLPRRLAPGLAVVVASRPDPPLPDDVPLDHPLRGACRTIELARSRHAEDAHYDAKGELKGILRGHALEADVLGLVTAAGSGMALADLAELTEADEWAVEDRLGSRTGRTFTRVDGRYVLAHEKLQTEAERLLGPARLDGLRQRLHAWADDYRARGWPAETPAFLLSGYAQMLSKLNDTERLVRHAIETSRQDLLLDRTGGDTVALKEITLAQQALMATTTPDLADMCRLALRRADLNQRNANLPFNLPQLWASIGNAKRAETFVRSLAADGSPLPTLLFLLPALAQNGHYASAEELLTIFPSKSYLGDAQPDLVITQVIRHFADAGEHQRAALLTERITGKFWRSRADCEIVISKARSGVDLTEGESLARRIELPYWQAQALAVLADEAAHRGSTGVARRLAAESEVMAQESGEPLPFAFLATVTDRPGQARRLAHRAVQQAMKVEDPQQRHGALTDLSHHLAHVLSRAELREIAQRAEAAHELFPSSGSAVGDTAAAWCRAGDPGHAQTLCNSLEEAHERESARIRVVMAAAAAGDMDGARRFVDSDHAVFMLIYHLPDDVPDEGIAELVGGMTEPGHLAKALTAWGLRAARRGDQATATALAKRAESICRSIAAPGRARLLTSLATALITAGDTGRARSAIRLVWETFRSDSGRKPTDCDLIRLAELAIAVNDHEAVADMTRMVNDPERRIEAQTAAAVALPHPEGYGEAVRLLDEAEATLPSITRHRSRVRAFGQIAAAMWAVGEYQRAADLNDSPPLTDSDDSSGTQGLRKSVAVKPDDRDHSLAAAVQALVAVGHFDRSETLVGLITDQFQKTTALESLATGLARAGHADRAQAAAELNQQLSGSDHPLYNLAVLFAELGDLDRADRVAASIGNDRHRAGALIALAHAADPARACALLLEPVRQERFDEIMDIVARVSPTAFAAITAHLLGESESES